MSTPKLISIVLITLIIGVALGYLGRSFTATTPTSVPELTGSDDAVVELAIDFLKTSPTFAFDGIEDSIEVGPIISTRDFPPSIFRLTIGFSSSQPGYGDRSGQVLAQVITDHEIDITINRKDRLSEEFEVVAATIDGVWDEMNQLSLIEQEWILESLVVDCQNIRLPDNDITIQFSKENALSGFGGCNNYFGQYEIGDRGEISFGQIASTLMACPEGEDQEFQYFRAIDEIVSFRIRADTLELSSQDGQTILEFRQA